MSYSVQTASGLSGIQLGQLGGSYTMSATDEVTMQAGLTIRLIPAEGGTIISIREEAPTHMVSKNTLHVIPQEADLSAELGKIITMHYLKKDTQ